jgi:hypothetical protein
MEINQPRNIIAKMRGHNLRNGVNWQETLKEKGRTPTCDEHLVRCDICLQAKENHFQYLLGIS